MKLQVAVPGNNFDCISFIKRISWEPDPIYIKTKVRAWAGSWKLVLSICTQTTADVAKADTFSPLLCLYCLCFLRLKLFFNNTVDFSVWNGRASASKTATTKCSIFGTGIPCTSNDFPDLLWMLCVSVCSAPVFPSGFQNCKLISDHLGGGGVERRKICDNFLIYICFIMSEKPDEPLSADSMPPSWWQTSVFSFGLALNVSVCSTRLCLRLV